MWRKLLRTWSMPPRRGRLVSTNLLRALGLVWESSPRWALASGALMLLQGLLPVVTLYLTKLVIDAVSLPEIATGDGGRFSHIVTLIALLGGITLASTVCSSVAGLVGGAQAQLVTDHIHDCLHAKSIAV